MLGCAAILREIDLEVAKIVLRQDRDAVSGLDPARQHGAGKLRGPRARFPVGQPERRALRHGHAMRVKRRGAFDNMRERKHGAEASGSALGPQRMNRNAAMPVP